jgi:hypothetical protein
LHTVQYALTIAMAEERHYEEGGTVEQFYCGWQALLHVYERDRAEHSHPGFAPHAHSHIKLIASRRAERNRTR